MSGHTVVALGGAALLLALGCATDLTLPNADRPAALVIVSGNGQEAEAGMLLEEPLTVRVVDAGNSPVAGAAVEFSFVGDLPGADLDPTSTLTDANGVAAATVRLGSVEGEQIIVASVAESNAPALRAQFTATAVQPDDHGGGKKKDGKHGDVRSAIPES